MGIVHAKIKLENPKRANLKALEISALVDTGSLFLCLPEKVRLQLKLEESSKKEVTTADGKRCLCPYVGPVRVQACFANHPGKCFGYRLFTSAGSIAFFPDNEVHHQDAGANREITDFLRGTDVLIMDTQYDANEYKRHTGWGHGCLDDVVSLAIEAEVKTLFLFHHDPNHDDARISQMLAHARKLVAARKGKLQVEAACEGVTVELPARARG